MGELAISVLREMRNAVEQRRLGRYSVRYGEATFQTTTTAAARAFVVHLPHQEHACEIRRDRL